MYFSCLHSVVVIKILLLTYYGIRYAVDNNVYTPGNAFQFSVRVVLVLRKLPDYLSLWCVSLNFWCVYTLLNWIIIVGFWPIQTLSGQGWMWWLGSSVLYVPVIKVLQLPVLDFHMTDRFRTYSVVVWSLCNTHTAVDSWYIYIYKLFKWFLLEIE